MKNTTLLLALGILLGGCDGGALLNDDAPNNDGVNEVFVVSQSDFSFDGSDVGDAYLLNYPMPGRNGGTRLENAVVLLPQGQVPDQGWPVLAWGHGTTGTADVCAPSASNDLAGYNDYLNIWLSAGYAIVAPDYEGLGTEGGHPYLDLSSEGRSLNFAVEAAVANNPALSNRAVALGHSQGGHAVLGAAALIAENPDIEMLGVVAIAPPSQLQAQDDAASATISDDTIALDDRVAAAVSRLTFGALILDGVAAVDSNFDASAYYEGNGSPVLEAVQTSCLGDISAAVLSSAPGSILVNGNVDSIIDPAADSAPEVMTYLSESEAGALSIAVPVLLQQGDADTIVAPVSTAVLQGQLAAVNDEPPQLIRYAGGTHGSVLVDGFGDALNFINALFADGL